METLHWTSSCLFPISSTFLLALLYCALLRLSCGKGESFLTHPIFSLTFLLLWALKFLFPLTGRNPDISTSLSVSHHSFHPSRSLQSSMFTSCSCWSANSHISWEWSRIDELFPRNLRFAPPDPTSSEHSRIYILLDAAGICKLASSESRTLPPSASPAGYQLYGPRCQEKGWGQNLRCVHVL